MSAALTNNHTFDVCATHRTGFAYPVIDPEMVLILAAAIDPIKGRAVAANAFL
jgi:hypothetical protein